MNGLGAHFSKIITILASEFMKFSACLSVEGEKLSKQYFLEFFGEIFGHFGHAHNHIDVR